MVKQIGQKKNTLKNCDFKAPTGDALGMQQSRFCSCDVYLSIYLSIYLFIIYFVIDSFFACLHA